jgi:prolyl oligopeptidase
VGNFKDWGGKDFIDLMKGVDFMVDRGLADPDRLAIMGGSYGGFMTFWAITQTDRFAAAIGSAAISNWYTLYAHTETDYAEFGFDGTPYEARRLYDKFSPVNYVSNVKTPLLMIHGDEDPVVPVSQAVEYYTALKKHGKTVKFLRFPREGHGIDEPQHRITLAREQAQWLEKYLRSN